jgi:CHAT domain-containing protein/uncharacterized protein HemY
MRDWEQQPVAGTDDAFLHRGAKMSRSYRSLRVALLALVCVAPKVTGSVVEDPALLKYEQPREVEIRPGERHEYPFQLPRDQFARVSVDRRSVGIEVTLLDGDGHSVDAGSSPFGRGLETFSVLATEAVRYRLVVGSTSMTTGRYAVWVSEHRPSEDLDALRVTAERCLRSAEALETRESVESLAGALDAYQQVFAACDQTGDVRLQARASQGLGDVSRVRGDHQLALEYYASGLALARTVGDRSREAHILASIGFAYVDARKGEPAKDYLNEALVLLRDLRDGQWVADVLNSLGQIAMDRDDYATAASYFGYALTEARQAGSLFVEGYVLNNIAAIAFVRGDYSEARDCNELALEIQRKMDNRRGQADSLQQLADISNRTGQVDRAVSLLTQALDLSSTAGNPVPRGWALYRLAGSYATLGQLEAASELLQEALLCFESRDPKWETFTLTALGLHQYYRARYSTALAYYSEALEKATRRSEPRDVGNTLLQIGRLHATVGEFDLAIERLVEASIWFIRAEDWIPRARALEALATVYRELREAPQAQTLFEDALAIYREMRAPADEASALVGIGETYLDQALFTEGVRSFSEALTIARDVGAVRLQAEASNGLARAYLRLGCPEDAVAWLNQALLLFGDVDIPIGEAATWSELMLSFRAIGQPVLAIVCGKQAVNLYQEIRAGVRQIGRNASLAFLRSKETVYRSLADGLIDEGRLAEAQVVLAMLKEEEYLEFTRQDVRETAALRSRVSMATVEKQLAEQYRFTADRLGTAGRERGELLAKKALTPKEQFRLAEVDELLGLAQRDFQSFLDRLEVARDQDRVSASRLIEVREAQGLMEDLRELGGGTVAIYTLVTETAYKAIVITPDIQVAREYPISRKDLYRDVADFREALQDPTVDPIPAAQRLYRALVAPIAQDLRAAGARTLLWSLDGALRYVPISALHDGDGFLVERYRLAVFTPASHARLKDVPRRHWTGLGLGVSKARGSFSALPGVRDELTSIFGAAGDSEKKGVLSGRVLLDETFTKTAMRAALRERYPVVHVASHFQFVPGDETRSFLLLGDGELSLAEIKSSLNLFTGTDLLTLSACNTATGGKGADGREVEGFGVLAQRQGAKAIVATLWPVSDESTRRLMRRFYEFREAGPSEPKANALRRAQLELLHESRVVGKRKVKGPFSHPFYWAPFILIGNFR